jgi:hypothetical protein
MNSTDRFPSRGNQTNKYNQIKNMNIQSIKPGPKRITTSTAKLRIQLTGVS